MKFLGLDSKIYKLEILPYIMVYIQINLPKELNQKLALYTIKKYLKDKRISVIKILEEKLKDER